MKQTIQIWTAGTKKQQVGLLVLLLLIALVVRFLYPQQTDFDSYWIHGMSESITTYGHAKWVFHPTSLFGYYPLSYPSGLMFFLAFVSVMTGLSMSTVIFITGVLMGIVATFAVFLLGRKIGGFLLGYIAALLFTLSPQIVYYSSNIASGRFMLILFYLVFLLVLLEAVDLAIAWIQSAYQKSKTFTFRKAITLIGHVALAGILVAFMFLIHRTAQLTVLFIIAAIATIAMHWLGLMWDRIREWPIMHKLFWNRYKRWQLWPLVDGLIIIGALIALKMLDLILRNRFLLHLRKAGTYAAKGGEYLASTPILLYAAAGLLVAILLVLLLVKLIWKVKYGAMMRRWYFGAYHAVAASPSRFFYTALLLVALVLFVLQFFGMSFYSPSLEEYEESELYRGTGPLAVFINFIVNYTSAVTILSMFAIIAIFYVFLKKDKHVEDIFLLFVTLAFISILIDKRYVRLFVTPLIALLAAYGLLAFYAWLKGRINPHVLATSFVLVLIVATGATFIPQVREAVTGREASFNFRQEYWDTGSYIRSLDCQCSTITTEELTAGVTIFASSGVPGGSHNIYYYVNKTYITPNPINWTQVRERLERGEKVAELYYLPDWIFGGQYYHGRHTRILFEKDYRAREAQQIIKDYRIKYFIHDKDRPEPIFFDSIEPVFNEVYDNPRATVYHLEKGRVAS